MPRIFTSLSIFLLLAMAAVQASRSVIPWQIEVEGHLVPPLVSLIVAAVLALVAIAVWLEQRAAARHRQQATTSQQAVGQTAATRSLETRAPLAFTVKKGARYRAEIVLTWWEQSVATNEYIADQLASVGFTDVSVIGSGAKRIAEGLWPHEDQTAEMPSQIISAAEIPEQPPEGTIVTASSDT